MLESSGAAVRMRTYNNLLNNGAEGENPNALPKGPHSLLRLHRVLPGAAGGRVTVSSGPPHRSQSQEAVHRGKREVRD